MPTLQARVDKFEALLLRMETELLAERDRLQDNEGPEMDQNRGRYNVLMQAIGRCYDVLRLFGTPSDRGTHTTYIGLSLSMCVSDMLEGKVNPNQVQTIISGCLSPSDGPLIDPVEMIASEQFNSYFESYWKGYTPAHVEAVLRGIPILARRHRPLVTMNIGNGRWIVQHNNLALQCMVIP